jgi:Ran GTPase-activating protein (RanGAP) involved in mRNA processing and transport
VVNKLSSTTPYCASNEKSEIENSPNKIPNISAGDSSTDVLTATQKTAIITTEHFDKNAISNTSEKCNWSEEKPIVKNNTSLIKICGTQDFWVSADDLLEQSAFFKNMFLRNWKENITRELIIEGKTGNSTVKDQFIQCLVTRTSECLNEGNFQELLILADKYEVLWLVKDCEQFIISNLTFENVLSVIKDIAEPYNLPELLDHCFYYLTCNNNSLGEDPDFMKEIQALGKELQLVELKIIASQVLRGCMSLRNPYIFDITMQGRVFEYHTNDLIEILSGKSSNKFSVNLTIQSLCTDRWGFLAIAKFLKGNPKLETLQLTGRDMGGISNEETIEMVSALKENNRLISLSLNYKLYDQDAAMIAAVLQENKTLTSLNLAGSKIKDAGATAIAEALKGNKTLTEIYFNNSAIGDAGAIQIGIALKENDALTKLVLSGNKIGAAGVTQIAEALKGNKTLTELNLNYNDTIGTAGAVQIAKALKENRTLTSLYLNGGNIKNAGAAQIAAALKENKTLTILDLNFNRIGDNGIVSIAAALHENKALTRLNLKQKEIKDKGAIHMAAALKKNKTLTNLDVSCTTIGNKGAMYIAAALKKNTTLISLNLSNTEIGNEGVMYIAAELKKNTTLTSLNLSETKIGEGSSSYILAALKANTTLTNLDIRETEIEDESADHIIEALKKNKK